MSRAEAIDTATGTRWCIVALAILAGVIGAMQVGKAPPAIPIIQADLGIGRITAGWVMSIFLAASAVLGPFAGVVGDRIGHRRFMLAGLLLTLVGGVIGGLAPDGPALLIARLIEGFGFLAIVIAAPSLIVEVTAERDLRMAIGAWGAYMPAGIALMLLLAPLLLASVGWRGMWYANAAALGVFLLVFAAATRGVGASAAAGTSLADIRIALSRLGPWLLAGCFAAFSLQYLGVVSWLPSFFMEEMGRSSTVAAVIVAIIVIFNALGNVIAGWLLQWIRRSTLIAATSAAMGILSLVIFANGVPEWIVIVLAAGYSLIGGFIPAAALTAVPVYAPSAAQIGATNGIVVQGANLGSLIGPPAVAAVVAAVGGWETSAWFLVIMAAVCLALALMLRPTEHVA